MFQDLFFKFPQNNFLHTLTQQCVAGLLNLTSESNKASPVAPSQQEEAMDVTTSASTEQSYIPYKASDPLPAVDSSSTDEKAADDTVTQQDNSTPTITDTPEVVKSETVVTVTADEEARHVLLCQLLREGKLLQRILVAYDFKLTDCDLPSVPQGSLCGFRGHLRYISNAIVEHSSPKDGMCSRLLETSLPPQTLKTWQEFVCTALPQANALNEIVQVNDSMLQMGGEEDVQ